MGLTQRWREIRSGFEPPFWIANTTEIFERIAYYGTTAVLAIYLTEQLHFSSELATTLLGIAGFVVYALSILAGTLADRFGFRRTLMAAYLLLTVGLFPVGISRVVMDGAASKSRRRYVARIDGPADSLARPGIGEAVRGGHDGASLHGKRSITRLFDLLHAREHRRRSGSADGVGGAAKTGMGNRECFPGGRAERVFDVLGHAAFFREPGRFDEVRVASVSSALKNIYIVLGNLRYVTFLLISSGFYIVYWQIFISVPIFMRRFVNPDAAVDRILSIEAATVICFQILVTYLMRKIPAVQTIAIGFLLAGLSWILLAVHPTMFMLGALLVLLALGELTQASRYYEYCSRLAPADQQGLYMGYAFLPIAIGYAVAGRLGGYLLHEFGDVLHRPAQMWWVIAAIGVLTAALMWLYDKIVQPRAQTEPAEAVSVS